MIPRSAPKGTLMGERRKYPRIRAKFPCDLHLAGASSKVTIRDLSEGGLSVLADLGEPEQGDPVELVLHPPNRPSVELSCVFWHSRHVRVVGEDRSTAHMGLVLASPSDAYFDLVAALRGSKPRLPASADATEPIARPLPRPAKPTNHAPAVLGRVALQQFSVRVKQNGGPRSTRLVVAAQDVRDAEVRALAEVGEGWIALETRRVKAIAS